ncbi:Oxidoreductases acting on the CH-OH group of donors With NAD(+) or NADP(+) as acceptor [Sarracenia purpurea var. burkii]
MVSWIASIEKASFFIPSPDNYAGAAVRRIGYEARCTPYWTHSLQWFFSSLLPEAILDSWRLSIGIRRRGKLIHEHSSSHN